LAEAARIPDGHKEVCKMAKSRFANVKDGPASPQFKPIAFPGTVSLARLASAGVSEAMAAGAKNAPAGRCVFWGIPFRIGKAAVIKDRPVSVNVRPFEAEWIVFLHLSDARPVADAKGRIQTPVTGEGHLGEHAADYVVVYDDGTEERMPIRRRFEVGIYGVRWGEDCVSAVKGAKPVTVRASISQNDPNWGRNQTRVGPGPGGWGNWLWAWENPHRTKRITGFRFEPASGAIVLSAITAGSASSRPIQWRTRRKAMLTLPKGVEFDFDVDAAGLLKQIGIDLGQVISALPRPVYPNRSWARTYNNRVPEMSAREVLVEYTSHADACFHLPGGKVIPAARLESAGKAGALQVIAPATERVELVVREKATGKTVAAKLHIHGEAGEYLAPVDRHRIINPEWFEDYSADFTNQRIHHCTYIPGRTVVDLPVGRVYVEVSKGFEMRPVRKAVVVKKGTRRIVVEIEKVLPWRERSWVTADTHVHFLSPTSALLEGAGEGVNVVNLLASQWSELMTNVGDFDGRTTHGSKEAGGDGEYLVRVGTENRQRVMGHISLLGYKGDIIAPMTTGGPDESAIGDPVGALLTEWGRQCKAQGGVVVLPHFPGPRLENAAAIVSGMVDAVEMSSRTFLYRGISPYSLLDWYRYLNCGYMCAAAGGTDKMEAETAVGTLRTYAQIEPSREFTYETWKEAVRAARTFVTCGPLLEFEVEGKPAGSRIAMSAGGGTVDVTWHVASVTMPVSRVELIVNGEVRESVAVDRAGDAGSWPVKVEKSTWMALLVRGHYADKPEIIAAHSSPVMVEAAGSEFFAAADAVTILEQIEGALAYIETVGTRAETKRYKEMRLVLTAAHRGLHNRLHEAGFYHNHSATTGHAEHH
jgi:hypothetical protein